MFDLGCWIASRQSKVVAEFISEFMPFYFRISNMVCVEVSGSPAKLGREWNGL
jgi:hypothetical protein